MFCNDTHQTSDEKVGQPICAKCYNYVGHVLFTWHLPELWRRFTIALRRTLRMRLRAAGVSVDAARVSFVKVVELQARLIPHIHALIRLDPHETDAPNDQGWQAPITAPELASIIQHAARTVTVTVDDPSSDTATRVIRFGAQVDTQSVIQPTTAPNRHAAELDSVPPSAGRQVARYLAKYVTKSLADVGISARRISAEAIPHLDVSAHVRTILTTIAELAGKGLSGIGRWLHTLGYRGHITSKSRRYSTTMTALRERRATWTRERSAKNTARQHNNSYQSADIGDSVCWEFDRAGHASIGDRTLIISAAQRTISQRRTAREQLRQHELLISQGWRGDG
ncbi:plasmid replication initiator protein [Mycobacterium avium 11-0986]|nr:plasmid replication initiator protein [Mycobacterium avium 11-0986]